MVEENNITDHQSGNLLYKYKSLRKFHEIKDILEGGEIYFISLDQCSLGNDPGEDPRNRSPFVDLYENIDSVLNFSDPLPFFFCVARNASEESSRRLWEEHADQSRGVVIRFRHFQEKQIRCVLTPVTYSQSSTSGDGRTKPADFCWESEWRFIALSLSSENRKISLADLGLEIDAVLFTGRTTAESNFPFLESLCTHNGIPMERHWIST